ncbi:hypothetical protein H8356DRAFT_1363959 [Neocallimastix lanati (nom. inval.)]|nr:hypothetical protein H8356DRAFT_1363959 [Neocallimastix sp. JGI-2020a]
MSKPLNVQQIDKLKYSNIRNYILCILVFKELLYQYNSSDDVKISIVRPMPTYAQEVSFLHWFSYIKEDCTRGSGSRYRNSLDSDQNCESIITDYHHDLSECPMQSILFETGMPYSITTLVKLCKNLNLRKVNCYNLRIGNTEYYLKNGYLLFSRLQFKDLSLVSQIRTVKVSSPTITMIFQNAHFKFNSENNNIVTNNEVIRSIGENRINNNNFLNNDVVTIALFPLPLR